MKILCAVLLFSLVACGQTEIEDIKAPAPILSDVRVESVAYESVAMNAPIDNEYAGDRILKTARLRFQVDSVKKSTRSIEAIVLKYNGIVADQSISNATDAINNNITLRVPAGSFEKFIDDVCRESVFTDYKKISSQNVTEEYEDIQARLKTKREVRDRYADILKTKAKTVEDILKAEEHIRVLQEEIESREGRLRFLQSRTAMSEINLQIYQKVMFTETPTLVEKTFTARTKDALGAGWSTVTGSVLFVISCWPFLIVCFVAVVAWRRFKRRLNAEAALETSVE